MCAASTLHDMVLEKAGEVQQMEADRDALVAAISVVGVSANMMGRGGVCGEDKKCILIWSPLLLSVDGRTGEG